MATRLAASPAAIGLVTALYGVSGLGVFNGGQTAVLGFGYAIAHIGYPGIFRIAACVAASAAVFLLCWSPTPYVESSCQAERR